MIINTLDGGGDEQAVESEDEQAKDKPKKDKKPKKYTNTITSRLSGHK